ncbi:MAG TPA: ornithine cyclodeaminase family protein [Opitutaceae bacterium]|nr:ornithine cyclodeaminase family protein [Opitutaceae bacterium]
MQTTPPALLLDRPTVGSLLTLPACIEAVERAFAAHARGETFPSGLLHGDGVDGEFHVKAGGLKSPRAYFACKVNGGFFQNRARHDLPNIQGLILLYDATNGVPLAVMESATVTLLRTGAATAVAARYLAPRNASVATICGAGTQGAVQLRALHRVLPLKKVYVWTRDSAHARVFAENLSAELQLDVTAASELRQATQASDVIVTCTPARKWLIGREHVRPGTFVAAVGADSPDKQEIEPALLAHSAVVCDLTAQCMDVGDLHHAISEKLMTAADVRAELGQVVAGLRSGRKSPGEVVVFDSTGTALQDAAAAALVYEQAVARQVGVRFPFWGKPAHAP